MQSCSKAWRKNCVVGRQNLLLLPIDKNVPIPTETKKTSRSIAVSEVLEQMEVGDSVLVPYEAYTNIYRGICFWKQLARDAFDYKLTHRYEDSGARIWRIA